MPRIDNSPIKMTKSDEKNSEDERIRNSIGYWETVGIKRTEAGKILSKKQKNDLIKSIPDDTYSKKDLILIVKFIKDNAIQSLSHIPERIYGGEPSSLEINTKKKQSEPESESDESSSDEEAPPPPPVKKGFTPEFTKFGNLTAGSKDTLVKLLERRTKIDPKVRASIRNAIKNNKCQSPEQFDNYQPKVKKEPPPKKVKAPKPTDPFFGVPPVPKGKHQASMSEAAKAKKILYWGVKKADSKIIDSMVEKPKEKKGDLQIKIAGLRGALSRLKREYDQAKTAEEKKTKMTEFEAKRQEILEINERL